MRSTQNRYFIADRVLELPELKPLVDAVDAARFIPVKQSRAISRKLIALTGEHQAKAACTILQKTSYTYDWNSRLSGVEGLYTVNGGAYAYTQSYAYDGMGRLTGYTGNGVTTAYSYTTMGDVSTVKTTYGGFSAIKVTCLVT